MANPPTKPVPQAPAVPPNLGSYELTVRDPAGNPLQAEVSMFVPRLEETKRVRTNPNGVAVIPDLPPGEVTVTVQPDPGFGPPPKSGSPFKAGPFAAKTTIFPGPDPTVEDTLFTKPVGYLRIHVQKPDKTPLAKVPVSGPVVPPKTITDAGGTTAFFEVQPGTHNIEVGTTEFTVKPRFGQTNDPALGAIIGATTIIQVMLLAEVVTTTVVLEEKRLEIVKLDDHFAPSKENLDIRFAIAGLSGRRVILTIEGENYPGKKLVERDLGKGESSDGLNNLIGWTGKIELGAMKDQFAHPLLGPFKVTLFHDDLKRTGLLKDSKPFKILYHSVVAAFGKHMADEALPPESDQIKFVQAKLNELHYDAGPVNGTLGPVTTNAIKRFQRANYQVGAPTPTLLTESGTIDATLIAAIKAATAREVFESGKTPITQDAKFYVYDNFMNDRGANFALGVLAQFHSGDRKTHAEDKMERGFIPLEVEVKLLNKANAGVSAPDAVGPALVAWEVADAAEDDSVIPGTNALAKAYCKNARQIGATATVAGAARIDANGDNALDTFDGMRKAADGDYIKQWFPDSSDSKLEPYAVKKYDTESRDGKTFQRAVVEAWADPKDHPTRKGRAGAYFRFSFKGGDNAKVRAALTFKGLPNQAQLEKDHTAAKVKLFQELGKWTAWRRTKVNAYCQQGTPTRTTKDPDWSAFRDRFKEAYIEVENNGQPERKPTYSSIVTPAKYSNAILLGLTPAQRPGVTAANLIYRPDAVFGGTLRAQANGEPAMAYVLQMEGVVRGWCANPLNVILEVLYKDVRLTRAEGYVVWDFRLSDPVTGQDWNPALNHGAGGFQATANPNARNHHIFTAGYDFIDGSVTMCVDNPFNITCYLCHECGHARFLTHHRFVPGESTPTGTANPGHHDTSQDNCTMSYSAPGDTADGWRYPFCGKCLLRMRGLKVTALPDKYT